MPTIGIFCSLFNLTKYGISSRHGGHHEPQIFTSTGPRNCSSAAPLFPFKHGSFLPLLTPAEIFIEAQSTTSPLLGVAFPLVHAVKKISAASQNRLDFIFMV